MNNARNYFALSLLLIAIPLSVAHSQTSDTQTNNLIQVKFIQAESFYKANDYQQASNKLRQIEQDHNISLASMPKALNLQIKILISQKRYIQAQAQLQILLAKRNLPPEILSEIAEYSIGLDELVIREQEIRTETTKAVESIFLSMIELPGGVVTIGSPENEINRGKDEVQKVVEIRPFKLSKYELTKAQFAAFVNATSYRTDAQRRGGCYYWDKRWRQNNGVNWQVPVFSQSPDEPVSCVTWADANNYIAWLNQVTGSNFRLPKEAEWEYAARAGRQSPFESGQCLNSDQANFRRSPYPGCVSSQGFLGRTTEVGYFSPNAFNLYDMHGNVAEWTCSLYSREYNGEENSCSDLLNAKRVLRGGSWRDRPAQQRLARRTAKDTSSASRAYNYYGFRLAQDVLPQ